MTGGPPPPPPAPGQGSSGVPGPRSPPPPAPRRRPSPLPWKLAALARHSARDPGCAWTARPALRRLSWTPKRAAGGPLPHRRDGVRPPTCRPLPSRVRPSGSRGRRIRSELVKGEERDQGGSASPSPGTGGGGAAAPSPKLPPLASPSAERKLPPPPAGLTWGRGRGLGARPPAPGPSPAFPPGSERCAPNKVPSPEPGAARAVVAGLGGAGGRGLHLSAPAPGGRRGALGSPPGHSLPETSPLRSARVCSRYHSSSSPSPLPLSWGQRGPEPRVPPGPRDGVVRQPSPGGEPPALLPWEPRDAVPCGALLPGRGPPCSQLPGPAPAGSFGAGFPEAGESPGAGAGEAETPHLRIRGRAPFFKNHRLARPPPGDPRVLGFSLSISAVPRLSVASS